ncbi:GH92 family glycosyl hydrolase [Maribellus maritimus]|uniref:GH92 family glycosyl hydrolase n=1 Tax=Maribellus maritimus TaxID=2870838 RepID=UPI001EEBEA13|nr:GH92 family glycosyl hydrolase [Maribellus maritimus]MCG6189575.1 GH92 family glycosyl hydrolase [Maribellus maritimus]
MMKLAVVILLSFLFFVSCSQQTSVPEPDYTKYVDPFIGAAEYGHCFPGACVPFGLIQVGSETGNGGWEYCSGYQSTDSTINGFTQDRLNGTGCPDLGDLLILPFSGEKPEVFKSTINKKTETASPGYYAVQLTDFDIDAEMTATPHVALHRYKYPEGKTTNLLVDFQSSQCSSQNQLHAHVQDAEVNFEGDKMITGYSNTSVWLNRTYYYVIEFNKPIIKKELLPNRSENEKAPRYVLEFDLGSDEELMIKVALSSTGVEGAKANLAKEKSDWNFETTVEKAKQSWNELLARVDVQGDNDKKTMFYTSMYRLFIQPNNIADVDQAPFYSTLSLWDTYRAAHPLYTILAPGKVDDFVHSMLHQYDNQGFLPIWALWGKETFCMIGNHAVPVIVDAYLKGFKGFDAERAFEAVKTSLTSDHQKSSWAVYDKYGYYPFDVVKEESVSRTMESAYDDYCAAQFAKVLGKEDDYMFFLERSNYWKNLIDPETKLARGKNSDGNWRTPFNSFSLSHAGTSGGDYTEGNAWQYTWHVQHDVDGLIDLLGGKENFTTKLDSLFEMEESSEGTGFVLDVTGLIGQYAHGNEPSHHVAYLYTLAGKPWRTQELLNEIVKTKYINKIDGLCGNDDCGQMSAWYIFTNLGFYPLNPCGGEYILGAPQLPKAVVNLPNGKTFTVEAKNFSDENIYVKSVELNDKPYNKLSISHEEVMNGGTLIFEMGNVK